jgi:peptidoglycan/LPS O-acetylase OafA/YrhL
VIEANSNPTWAYFNPLSRAWELGIGAVLASLVPLMTRIPRTFGFVMAWLGIGAIIYAAVSFSGRTTYPGWSALVPVLGAGAVVAGGSSGIGAGHLLNLRPVRSVGRVSYGWYLLHFPLMIILVGVLWSGQYLSIEENLLIAGCTLVAAYVMYFLLERPIRRSRYLAEHPILSIALGLAFVGAALLVCEYLRQPLIFNHWFQT